MPYSHEQIGKNEEVFFPNNKDKNFDCYLRDYKECEIFDTEMLLEQGDILYIPRGVVHSADTMDSHDDNNERLEQFGHKRQTNSLHVTFTVPSSDFTLASLLQQAWQDLLFNSSLNSYVNLSDKMDQRSRRSLHLKSLPINEHARSDLHALVSELSNCLLDGEGLEFLLRKKVARINAKQKEQHAANMLKPLPSKILKSSHLVRFAEGIQGKIIEIRAKSEETTYCLSLDRLYDGSRLNMNISSTASFLLKQITGDSLFASKDSSWMPITSLKCDDEFEKMGILQILIDKGCLCYSISQA